MDPGRSAHPPKAPASTSLFAPMQSFTPATDLASAVSQQSNPFTMASKPAPQPFAAPPLQSTSVGAAPTISQNQPFAQALNASSASGFPVASQGIDSESIPRSETMPATQPATDVYPHQVNGLGGPTATAPFLQDFSLVAEAAKRAQMGIVMRDLESVTL
ncbi:uncharacterized protein N7503_006811 [Penicillium pulvis]|uniref:uncharacterized protein n=1 Tax=Penicillium pulvis TaxID=1562058 RepID=UPI002546EFD2|nr:uncharacterized protein N7503_006811 [Penicillium pulvis]KAJ5797515.1 hypothetical protein N7503_006811 [Penicillium pulvis]